MIQWVHGYALPWDAPAYVDGLVETVAPMAVAADTARNITLLFGDHESEGRQVFAQTRSRSLTLFADDYGLGFSASVDDETRGVRGLCAALARGSVTKCSVNFSAMHRRDDGRIIWAAIDHIALVHEGAYEATGCWLGGQPDRDRPAGVQALAARHLQSRMDAYRRDIGRAPVVAGGVVARHAVHPSKPTVPASVIALLEDPRLHAFTAADRRWETMLTQERSGS